MPKRLQDHQAMIIKANQANRTTGNAHYQISDIFHPEDTIVPISAKAILLNQGVNKIDQDRKK